MLMKRVAGRQTRYVKKLEKRTGTFWEESYKSSPINADSFLMACCPYIELSPVRGNRETGAEDQGKESRTPEKY